jgi:hypothetical protein
MPSLAVSDVGALAAWSRERPSDHLERLSIEVADRLAGEGRTPPSVGLRPIPVPRMSAVRVPAAVGFREPLHIRLRLSRPARIEVHIVRVKPVRFLGPFRRSGQTGANRIAIPTWGAPGRRLGPGVYDVRVQALTSERESCPVTRRLVVRE